VVVDQPAKQESRPDNTLLTTDALTVAFGGLVAVDGVSLQVRAGEVFGIIGPNGAGKTTLFNALTGLTMPTSGRVLFANQDITELPSWKRARMGLARTFQNLRLFPEMTVFQTVLIGRQARREAGLVAQLLGTRGAREDEWACRQRAFEEVTFVGLEEKINVEVKHLPYGDRRRVEIARALATDPRLLLLDEPAAGMNPQECNELLGVVQRIRDRGLTVVLVEHHMRVVMGVCDRIAVLDHGGKIAEGVPGEIRADPNVIEAYLGKGVRVRARA
jgi:ABC-type branched-subunit amino acid transport system ATPase component